MGIKTFIVNIAKNPHSYFFKKTSSIFNNSSISKFELSIKFSEIINNLKANRKSKSVGDIFSYPDEIAVRVWKNLIQYNPNNFGNWSIKDKKITTTSGKSEKELIDKLLNLYKSKNRNIEGYVTSGATEANIYSLWMARKYMESKNIKGDETILIKTGLTHFSIDKAASITNVKTNTLSINSKDWGMDTKELELSISKLFSTGHRGFFIPITIGYTLTGTSDSIENILKVIRDYKCKYKNKIFFFLWIDSANTGLINPLVNKKYDPLSNKEIMTIILDFHKFGFAPIPTGIILYRKHLRKMIESPTYYLSEQDSTLLGSRSGISAVACNFIIEKYGKIGLLKIFNKNLNHKKIFIDKVTRIFGKKIIIISEKNSLGCAIIAKKLNTLMNQFAKDNGVNFKKISLIVDNKKTQYYIAKAYFLDN